MEITIKEIIVIIFGLGAVVSGFLVISSINPMHSVVALVLTFANAAGLLVMLEAEFLAILFVIVYAGAIAILILFVVMMLNIKLVELVDNTSRYVPIGFIIGFVLLIELCLIFTQNGNIGSYSDNTPVVEFSQYISTLTNIENLGNILYTEYYIYFIVSSLVLLVAMVGAIVLTLSHEEYVKRQDLFSQISSDHSSIVYATHTKVQS